MARINLLPWREELRKQRQREFVVTAVGAAILGGLAVLVVHLQFDSMISDQQARNQYLEQEIKKLDKRIASIKDLEKTKDKLLARMNVIQELQSSRPQSVHLMDELVRTLPEGVYLTSVEQRGQQLTLKGEAQSNARVSAYMRNIDSSDWLGDPKLAVIQTKAQQRRRVAQFTLGALQESGPTGAEEGQ